jgi:SAM-dependent methyltransferase
MNADQMLFPDELFDVVLSNCGIAYTTFPAALAEAYRVLRKGGTFVLNDWHLKDVQAHRVFGGILQQHRTNHPSKRLREERTAMATFERTGSRYSDLNELVTELHRAGFTETRTKYRTYKIRLRGVQEFLAMRLEREALKRELRELTQAKRRMMLDELRRGLNPFLQKGRFIFDWKVAYVSARKPN